MKHWLLVIGNSNDFIWSFVLKEKSNLVDIMIGLIKNLKNKYNLQLQYLNCNNAGENISFEKACKQEGLGVILNIQPQLCHNKTATLKESIQLSTCYAQQW